MRRHSCVFNFLFVCFWNMSIEQWRAAERCRAKLGWSESIHLSLIDMCVCNVFGFDLVFVFCDVRTKLSVIPFVDAFYFRFISRSTPKSVDCWCNSIFVCVSIVFFTLHGRPMWNMLNIVWFAIFCAVLYCISLPFCFVCALLFLVFDLLVLLFALYSIKGTKFSWRKNERNKKKNWQ